MTPTETLELQPSRAGGIRSSDLLSHVVGLCNSLEEKEREVARQRSEFARYFGDAMRTFRERKKISLREAARQLGISAPYLSDMELGRRMASEKWLRKAYDYVA